MCYPVSENSALGLFSMTPKRTSSSTKDWFERIWSTTRSPDPNPWKTFVVRTRTPAWRASVHRSERRKQPAGSCRMSLDFVIDAKGANKWIQATFGACVSWRIKIMLLFVPQWWCRLMMHEFYFFIFHLFLHHRVNKPLGVEQCVVTERSKE